MDIISKKGALARHRSVKTGVLCLILIAAATASACLFLTQSEDSSATGTGNYEVSGDMSGTYSDLKTAIVDINAKAGGMNFIITVMSDDPNVSAFTLNTGKNVTLISSEENVFMLTKIAAGRHCILNGSLTLENIILDGSKNDGGIAVNASGSLTMKNGAVIQNCYVAGDGGGVYTYGTFTMNGGAIIGNAENGNGPFAGGGGVYIENKGIFTMNGGEIRDNTATNGGGVYNNDKGTFTINGGVISGNTATNGGGVYDNTNGTSKFTMNSGEIAGNKASSGGGGVFNNIDSKFTMNGGVISGNTASSGGGVRNGGTFTMIDGAISGNTATSGGGVRSSSTFTMTGGVISGNTASGSGGGVYNEGTFVIDSGEISGNTAKGTNTKGSGGGIYTTNFAKLSVAGGVVFSGNIAPTLRTLSIADDADIDGNGIFDLTDYDDKIGAVILDERVCAGQEQPAYNNHDINYLGDAVIASVYVVESEVDAGGTVTIFDTNIGVEYGKLTASGYIYIPKSVSSVTVLVTAGSGQVLMHFIIDGTESVDDPTVISILKNISVTAEFDNTSVPEPDPTPVPDSPAPVHKGYFITAAADSGSEISPGGKVAVQSGMNETFIFSAKAGYQIAAVYVDGEAISKEALASGEYTIYSVHSNHTIEVVSEVSNGSGGVDSGSEGSSSSSSTDWNGILTVVFSMLVAFVGTIAAIAARRHQRKHSDAEPLTH